MKQISVTQGSDEYALSGIFYLSCIKQADKSSLNSLSSSQVHVSEAKTAAQIVIPQTISTEHKKQKPLAADAQDLL